MNVSKVMQKNVATVRVAEHLDRVAELLRARDCGCVIVADDERRPLGVVTDRDIALAALRTGKPLAAIGVEAAMSKRVHTCRSEESVGFAQQVMSLHQVRRLPVVDKNGRLAGVLALDDIAREACREEDLLAPPVSCAAVGRTLGQIVRPHLIESENVAEGS